jgi:hypothetical protein
MLEWFKCYIETTLNTDSNTAATITISLFIFGVGYSFASIGKLISGIIQRNRLRKLISNQVNSLIGAVKKQSIFFSEFSDKLDLSKNENLMLENMIMPDLKNFERIEFEKVYQAYSIGIENIFNLRSKKYDEIIRLMGSLIYFQEGLSGLFKDFSDSNNTFNEKWSIHIEDLRKLVDKISTEANNTMTSEADTANYFNQLDLILIYYQEMNDNTKKNTYQNFVKPLISLNRRFSRELSEFTLPMFEILMECDYDFKNLDFLYKDYYSVFNGFALSYREIYRKLTVVGK